MLIWAHLGDTAGSIPDFDNQVSIAIKQVLIFLLVEGFALHL